jgi:Glycosyltransferase family 87
MVNGFLLSINKLSGTKRRVYCIGFVFAFLITLKEALRFSYNNFQIFSYGSHDFWRSINPYSDWNHLSILGKPLDVFLYGPLFSILFTPFALLPSLLGVFCWNIFTYSLFYFSIFTLPDQFSFVKKKFIFFFTILLLFTSLLSVQFNPVVASFFLFSFTLLEKRQGFWAVLLIFLSGFTKVYGIFQLSMLIFYPGFRKNTLYALLIGIVFIFLPLVHIPLNELVAYYQSWIVAVMNHSEALRFYSIYRPICLFYSSIEPFMGLISLGVLLIILSFTLIKLKLFKESFLKRVQFLGILMSWAILFGVSSERHTYVIAIVGYAIWYLSSNPTRSDKVLLWINFILLGILPIDILCPWTISNFILAKLNLGVIVFTITWGIMVYKTFFSHFSSSNLHQKSQKLINT